MDDRIRVLERAVRAGDESKQRAFARELVRAGLWGDARVIYDHLLAQDPSDHVLRQEYVQAGGFWVERVDHNVLGDSFSCTNLDVGGELVDVVVGNNFLERTDYRSFDDWKTYAQKNKNGVSIVNLMLEGAVVRAMFERRESPLFQEVVKQYVEVFRKNEMSWPVFGMLKYEDGLQATLEELSLDRVVQQKRLCVPIFPENYVTLASEQSEAERGMLAPIGEETAQLLFEFFGQEYYDVVMAFQYCSARINNHLHEVGLWTLGEEGRRDFPERAVVLGVYCDRFDIYCYDYVSRWPALGVVVTQAQKKSP